MQTTRKLVLTLVALLLSATLIRAQSLTIESESVRNVTIVDKLPLKIKAPADALFYKWNVPQDVTWTDKDNYIEITKAPKGQLTVDVQIKFVSITDGKLVVTPKSASITFVVQELTPPTPPKPPEPQPSPAPIPVDGFRVAFVYESSKTSAQVNNILNSADLRSYLNSKCVVGPDGKTREWAIFDQDGDLANYPKLWQDVLKRERKSLPWVIISNHPTGGYEGPLPDTTAKTLELLKKYGGQ